MGWLSVKDCSCRKSDFEGGESSSGSAFVSRFGYAPPPFSESEQQVIGCCVGESIEVSNAFVSLSRRKPTNPEPISLFRKERCWAESFIGRFCEELAGDFGVFSKVSFDLSRRQSCDCHGGCDTRFLCPKAWRELFSRSSGPGKTHLVILPPCSRCRQVWMRLSNPLRPPVLSETAKYRDSSLRFGRTISVSRLRRWRRVRGCLPVAPRAAAALRLR